jgi:hypothetical protein
MPEPGFPSFQLTPDDTDFLSPDEELTQMLDLTDVEADDAAILAAGDDATQPFGRSFYLDFENNRANDQWVQDVQSLVMVAQVALNTVRGTSPILPDWFGRSGPDPMLGRVDSAEVRALAAADIRDTLLACHERISDVTNFVWAYDPDGDVIAFEADVEVDGEETARVGGMV